MAETDASTADQPSESQPTTFEDLPAEIRNRIYDESGCLQFYQGEHAMTSFCGDYTASAHHHVHACSRGTSCRFAEWPDALHNRRKAIILVNRRDPKHQFLTPSSSYEIYTNAFGPHLVQRDYCVAPQPAAGGYYRTTQGRRRVHINEVSCIPPALTQVSKKIRGETLGMFYGNHVLAFRFFGNDFQGNATQILEYLDHIGPTNSGYLRDVVIVCGQRKAMQFVDRILLPEMRRRGLNAEHTNVEVGKMPYPFDDGDVDVIRVLQRRGLMGRC